ncbi:hypothetical protein [Paeniglutamicibacter terrestris]|nr:hypothetical protein [Paeniglutamicibacter terrestris]
MLLDSVFNGADLALIVLVLAVAAWGERRDARRNAARAEQVAE